MLFMWLLSDLVQADSTLTVDRESQLRQMVLHDCGACHGMTLKGGLGPALTADQLEAKPDAALVTTILQGRAATAMPPWNKLISHQEALWIVQQLKAGNIRPD